MVGIGNPSAYVGGTELSRGSSFRRGELSAGNGRPDRVVATTVSLSRQSRYRETASGAAADRLNDTPRHCLGYCTSRASAEETAAACCCNASKLVIRPASALAATV